MNTFTLTEQHITLLRRMFVEWDDCETGAPAINPKRPYGNSQVSCDVGEILGIEPAGSIDEPDDYSEQQEDELMELHFQTERALQIVLCTGQFTPGTYQQPDEYNTQKWELVDE